MTIERAPVPAPPESMLPAEEALEVLGLTGPVELHARRFARSGGRVGMPAVRIGHGWFTSRDALDTVLARRTHGH